MKKILVRIPVSADGYFEGVGHEIDWHLIDGEFNAFALETPSATENRCYGSPVPTSLTTPVGYSHSSEID